MSHLESIETYMSQVRSLQGRILTAWMRSERLEVPEWFEGSLSDYALLVAHEEVRLDWVQEDKVLWNPSTGNGASDMSELGWETIPLTDSVN